MYFASHAARTRVLAPLDIAFIECNSLNLARVAEYATNVRPKFQHALLIENGISLSLLVPMIFLWTCVACRTKRRKSLFFYTSYGGASACQREVSGMKIKAVKKSDWEVLQRRPSFYALTQYSCMLIGIAHARGSIFFKCAFRAILSSA